MTKEMKMMMRSEFRIAMNEMRTNASKRVEQSETREKETVKKRYQKENTLLKKMSDNESIRIKRSMITRKRSLNKSAMKMKAMMKKKTTELMNQDQMMQLREKIRLEITKKVIQIRATCENVFKKREKDQQRDNALLKQEIKSLKLEIRELQARIQSSSQTRQTQFVKVLNSIFTSMMSRRRALFAILISSKTVKHSETTQVYQKKSFVQVTQQSSKDISKERWKEMTHARKKKQKTKKINARSQESMTRRMFFSRSSKDASRKTKENITLTVNEVLQRSDVSTHMRAIKAKYSTTKAISVLLEKKTSANMILLIYKDSLIKAIKKMNEKMTKVQSVEQWHRLRIHELSMNRYYEAEEMKLLRKKIEINAKIQLKVRLRWLIFEKRLWRRRAEDEKTSFAIIITVSDENEVKRLCKDELNLKKVSRYVNRYWETESEAICSTCCELKHDRFEECEEKDLCCSICVKEHRTKKHRCQMIDCTADAKRICKHDVMKCANCAEEHKAVDVKCSAKIRADVKMKKIKLDRSVKIAKKKFVRIVIYNSKRNMILSSSQSIQEKNEMMKDQKIIEAHESND